MPMRKTLIAGMLVAVAACGDAGTVTTSPTTIPPATTTVPPTTLPPIQLDLPTGADDVVLRIFVFENQPDPLPIAEAFPEFTLYGDGRLITRDRDAEFGPLPALQEAYLTPAGIQLLVDEWVRQGAHDPLDRYGFTGIADGSSTQFFIGTDPPIRFSVGDLGSQPDGPAADVTAEQLAARGRLAALRDAMRDYPSLVGAEIVSGPDPWVPERIAIVGVAGRGAGTREFPLDLTAGERIETRVSAVTCRVVDGTERDLLIETIADAPYLAPWQIGGQPWTQVFRPLLPDEDGCAELSDQ